MVYDAFILICLFRERVKKAIQLRSDSAHHKTKRRRKKTGQPPPQSEPIDRSKKGYSFEKLIQKSMTCYAQKPDSIISQPLQPRPHPSAKQHTTRRPKVARPLPPTTSTDPPTQSLIEQSTRLIQSTQRSNTTTHKQLNARDRDIAWLEMNNLIQWESTLQQAREASECECGRGVDLSFNLTTPRLAADRYSHPHPSNCIQCT